MDVRQQRQDIVRMRRMRRDDVLALETVFAGLSDQSRYRRFLVPTPRLLPSIRSALLDLSDRHVAFVAESPTDGTAIGIGRYAVTGPGEVEIALDVVDAWQRRGIGRLLLEQLVRAAGAAGIHRLVAVTGPDNRAMVGLARACLPGVEVRFRDRVVWLTAALPITAAAAA